MENQTNINPLELTSTEENDIQKVYRRLELMRDIENKSAEEKRNSRGDASCICTPSLADTKHCKSQQWNQTATG